MSSPVLMVSDKAGKFSLGLFTCHYYCHTETSHFFSNLCPLEFTTAPAPGLLHRYVEASTGTVPSAVNKDSINGILCGFFSMFYGTVQRLVLKGRHLFAAVIAK